MGAKKRVLISCHSTDMTLASKIADALSLKGYDHVVMTEDIPVQNRLREQTVHWAGVVVLLISSKYQHNEVCMQVAYDVKDCRQPNTAILVQPNYRPSGSLGILSFAGGDRIDFTDALSGNFDEAMEVLLQDITAKMPKACSDVPKPANDVGFQSKFGDFSRSRGNGIFISYKHDEGAKEIAQLVKNGKGISQSLNKVKITLGNQSKDNTSAIKKCQKFIAIVSPGYQDSAKCENEFECARAAKKHIILVKGDHKFRPIGWLAIAVAGKLCHEVHDHIQAYTPNPYIPNTNPINDLVEAVLAPPPPSQEEIEAAEIAALQNEIDKYKPKLWLWPPANRPPVEQREMPVLGWDDLVPTQDYEDHVYNTTTETIFQPPKPLVDFQDQPLDQEFDVMLSYQRDIRPFVQEVYMDLEKRGFNPWMAFTGMRGNMYTAMATAIEQSRVFVAFLTDKYQQGLNLALPYALSRNKPIIFIKAQPDLILKDWIKEAMSERLVFQMSTITSARITDYGVSRIDRLSEAIRLLSQWEREKTQAKNDVSEDLFNKRERVENAQYWIRAGGKETVRRQYGNSEEGSPNHYQEVDVQPVNPPEQMEQQPGEANQTWNRSYSNGGVSNRSYSNGSLPNQSYSNEDVSGSTDKKCTRCGGKYIGYSRYGCKKHTKYFLEGTIITGKWTCCEKRGRKAPGCIASSHITEPRDWNRVSVYAGTGCYNWVPE